MIVPEGFRLFVGRNNVTVPFKSVIQDLKSGKIWFIDIPKGTILDIEGFYKADGTIDKDKRDQDYKNTSIDDWSRQNQYIPEDLKKQVFGLSDWDLIKYTALTIWQKYKWYIIIGLGLLFLLLLFALAGGGRR